jgi:hypothetical protein
MNERLRKFLDANHELRPPPVFRKRVKREDGRLGSLRAASERFDGIVDACDWDAFPAALDALLDVLESDRRKPSRGHNGGQGRGDVAAKRDKSQFRTLRGLIIFGLWLGRRREVIFGHRFTDEQRSRINALQTNTGSVGLFTLPTDDVH